MPVTLPVADSVVAVITLAPVMLPDIPPVTILPPVMLPVALIKPVTYSPVDAQVAIALPATLAVMLLLPLTTTLLVPFVMAAPPEATIPVSCDPLPMK